MKIKPLSKLEQISLRLRLLSLWFVKNLSTFIWTFFIVCVVLVLMNQIDGNTPVIGPIFADFATEVSEIFNNDFDANNISAAIGSISSILIVTFMFLSRLKRISLMDIHTKKMKKLLIRANLYFDSNGKLKKRIEVKTEIDLDQDGKINDVEIPKIPQNEGIITSLKRAGEEFITIVKVDLSDVNKEEYNTTLLDEVKIDVETEEDQEVQINETTLDEEKETKESIFLSILKFIKKIFKKKDKTVVDEEPTLKEEIVEHFVEPVVEEIKKEEEKELPKEETSEVEKLLQEKQAVKKEAPKSVKDSTIEDFFNKYK